MPAGIEYLLGEVGLTVGVLLLIAYTVYENRWGVIQRTQRRLRGISVALYRIAQEVDGVDAETVRQEVHQNGDRVFPSDFDTGDDQRADGGPSVDARNLSTDVSDRFDIDADAIVDTDPDDQSQTENPPPD